MKFNITQSVEEVFLRSGVVPSCLKIKFSIVSSHWLCVLVSMCVGVSVWLVGVVSVLMMDVLMSETF